MPVRFRKKNRGMRGKTTHGWGTKKKHRGSGSQGGHGFAGMHKYKYSWVTSKQPDYFGKKGFVSLNKKISVINVGEVNKMQGENIDLSALGYDKLLSRGNISKAFTIKVSSYSARAKDKIEKAGGKIIK